MIFADGMKCEDLEVATLEQYCTETEAASIMGRSVEDFRRIVGQDYRAPKSFGMPHTAEPHYVRALIMNYRDAFNARFGR